jgi:hypothetical protein
MLLKEKFLRIQQPNCLQKYAKVSIFATILDRKIELKTK